MSIIHRALKKIDHRAAENPQTVMMSGGKSKSSAPPGGKEGPPQTRTLLLIVAIVLTVVLAIFVRSDAFLGLMSRLGIIQERKLKYEMPGSESQEQLKEKLKQMGVPVPKNLDIPTERGEAPGPGATHAFQADPVQTKLAEMFNEEGKALFGKANYAGARDKFLEALKRVPTSPEFNNNVGLTLKMMGHLSDAQLHYKRALELDPACAECMNNLAVVWMQTGQSAEARPILEKAIGLNPTYGEAHLNLAILLEKSGDWQSASKHYAQYKTLAGANLDPEVMKGINRRIRLGG